MSCESFQAIHSRAVQRSLIAFVFVASSVRAREWSYSNHYSNRHWMELNPESLNNSEVRHGSQAGLSISSL